MNGFLQEIIHDLVIINNDTRHMQFDHDVFARISSNSASSCSALKLGLRRFRFPKFPLRLARKKVGN